ncbi:hypothetical protein HQ571_02385 [Candidatus Kuenenbacteria bacterium]|nr:hypothetical protein [Candidatus Kuenenbacteria bacterium]
MEATPRQVEDLFDNGFEEAMKTIGRNFLTDPKIQVWLKKMKHFHFTVSGRINRPKRLEITAKKSNIFHVEDTENESTIYKFALCLAKFLEDLEVKPGFNDLCFIQTRSSATSLIYYTNRERNRRSLMEMNSAAAINDAHLTIAIAPDEILEL